MPCREIFVAGGTGYIGTRLIRLLLARGHSVRALTREASQHKLPPGCKAVVGNALDGTSFAEQVPPADTFVQLVGTPHPSPWKAAEFRNVDLASARASIAAARTAGVRHFVYVSVAQPAPVMQAYVAARAEGERLLRESGLNATILRPWYVLGPGHRWPYLLVPIYALMRLIPGMRDSAQRLGLVTLAQMVSSLAEAIEHPPQGLRILTVAEIRRGGRAMRQRLVN